MICCFERIAKNFPSKYEMFPLKDRIKVCNQIYSKTISSEAFLLERKTQFWKHCVNDFVRRAKIFRSWTSKNYKALVFLIFLPYFFLVIPTMTFIQSMLKNIYLKIRQIASQSQRKLEKEIFPHEIFFQTIVLDTYNAHWRKLPERFSPICERLLTKVHKKITVFSKNISSTAFWTGRKKLLLIIL